MLAGGDLRCPHTAVSAGIAPAAPLCVSTVNSRWVPARIAPFTFWQGFVRNSFRLFLATLVVEWVPALGRPWACTEGETMRRIARTLTLLAVVTAALMAMSASALAANNGPVGPGDADAFLCPAVGHGVTNADARNGDNGVSTIGPIGSGDQSFLPGNNQAGAHANNQAVNPEGPGTSPGPGNGNSDWSPIWPSPTG